MIIVEPIEVTDAILTATDVVNENPDWVPGTYALGERRVEDNKVYEVVADPNTTDQPSIGVAANPPSWFLLGWSNQFRMFRDGRDSLSTKVGGISVSLTYNAVISIVVALGLKGKSATLTLTDPNDGVVFTETISLVDIGVFDWWEWFFLPYDSLDTAVFKNIPPFISASAVFSVDTVKEDEIAAVGRLIAGVGVQLGVSNYGTTVGLTQFSTKERDVFGNLTLVPRRSVRIVNYDVTVKTANIDFVVRKLQALSGVPAVYIGDKSFPSTVTFGVYRDFLQGITDTAGSDLTIQVEEF